MRFQNYIFDLDDTLYREQLYLYAAYEQIASYLGSQEHDGSGEDAYLRHELAHGRRKQLFDRMLDRFNHPPNQLEPCLNILRTVQLPSPIPLYSGVYESLHRLVGEGCKLFVLTNGNRRQQENKVRQIDWRGLSEKISVYYAVDFKPKPSPLGIFKILQDHQLDASLTVFIGDADSDRDCATRAGIAFLRASEFRSTGSVLKT